MMPAWEGKLSDSDIQAVGGFMRSLGSSHPAANASAAESAKRKVYTPGDDLLFSLPTGRPVPRASRSRTTRAPTTAKTVAAATPVQSVRRRTHGRAPVACNGSPSVGADPPLGVVIASSACTMSEARCGRSAGRFSKHLMISPDSADGSEGRSF